MLPRFVFAIAGLGLSCGLAYSETFLGTLMKVEGNKVTYKKATYNPDAKGVAVASRFSYTEAVTVELAKDVSVTGGRINYATGRISDKDKARPLPGGLGSRVFERLPDIPDERRIPSLITIAEEGPDKGKITAINVQSSAPPK
jgi:hypothetical protein